jgi:hypothetical protein
VKEQQKKKKKKRNGTDISENDSVVLDDLVVSREQMSLNCFEEVRKKKKRKKVDQDYISNEANCEIIYDVAGNGVENGRKTKKSKKANVEGDHSEEEDTSSNFIENKQQVKKSKKTATLITNDKATFEYTECVSDGMPLIEKKKHKKKLV